MTRPTNVEFLTELMEYSNYGPLMQGFVMEALRTYAQAVVQRQDELPTDGFVSPAAWAGCASELLEKLEAHYAK